MWGRLVLRANQSLVMGLCTCRDASCVRQNRPINALIGHETLLEHPINIVLNFVHWLGKRSIAL